MQKLGGSEYDDPEVAGADSPNLELCRKRNAQKLLIQVLELRGLLVRLDRVNSLMGAIASCFRLSSDRLCPECKKVAEETLDEAADQYEQELPQVVTLDEDDYEQLDELDELDSDLAKGDLAGGGDEDGDLAAEGDPPEEQPESAEESSGDGEE